MISVLTYCIYGLSVLAVFSLLGVFFALSLKGALARDGQR